MTVTVLYDADCRFCTSCSRWLAGKGAAADFTPLQAVDLDHLGVNAGRAERELPAVLADGTVVYGAAAFAATLWTGPRWMRLLGRLLGWPPVAVLARWGYRLVAANRHRLPGGTESCALPERGHRAGP